VTGLPGDQSSYGRTHQNSPTSGYYHAFTNASHCQDLASDSDCYKLDHYTSYGQATADAIDLVTGRKLFWHWTGDSGNNLKKYNRVPACDFLDDLSTIGSDCDRQQQR
jgi:hypothetical protein